MSRKQLAVESVAEAYLALLAERGIEYLFANAGTDFAPIVDAYAKAAHSGLPAPKPLIATHENLAMSMAHGYAIASGKVPAVMVHVSVGTANALCGVFNASRECVPILFTAGRSPLTEEGVFGARDTYIHWAQEMFDQAGMLRELVKWEYELRNGTQLETVIDRAPIAGNQRAARAGISVAAARGVGRKAERVAIRQPVATQRGGLARRRRRSGGRGGENPGRGQAPGDCHRQRRARSGGGGGAG
jgi:thiamine pyrophosphate-dependent acetolactate synthase large subunit-like protein